MLTSLVISDYALIDELSVSFGKGLTILTGETGAGKSIIVGALGILLGERASAVHVRSGSAKAVVEGHFSDSAEPAIRSYLEQHELDLVPELILRREVSARGTTRCFINDTPVTLQVLRGIGDLLVDLHGQHDHQSLLRAETHSGFLDSYGGLEKELTEYGVAFARLVSLVREYEDTLSRAAELQEKRELYRFQRRKDSCRCSRSHRDPP
jgi:DNA repair protein RecN (Recombination protein N)